jgi:hypothetical protein
MCVGMLEELMVWRYGYLKEKAGDIDFPGMAMYRTVL